MITASLSERLARRGYCVTSFINAERAIKLLSSRQVALVVLAGRGDCAEIELVRAARLRGVPTILLALSASEPGELVVDGYPVVVVSDGALIAAVQAIIGDPSDPGTTGPPRAA